MARKPSGTITADRPKKAAARPAAPVSPAKPGAGPSPLEWAPVAIAAKEAKEHRGDLRVGKAQIVDLTVRIAGLVDVCEDSTANTKTAPKLKDVLTALFAKTPAAERNALARTLVKSAQALANLKVPAGVAETVDNVIASLTTQAEQPKAGAVTGAVTVELIDRKRG